MTNVGHARQTSLTYQMAQREIASCVYNSQLLTSSSSSSSSCCFYPGRFQFHRFPAFNCCIHSSKHSTEESDRHGIFQKTQTNSKDSQKALAFTSSCECVNSWFEVHYYDHALPDDYFKQQLRVRNASSFFGTGPQTFSFSEQSCDFLPCLAAVHAFQFPQVLSPQLHKHFLIVRVPSLASVLFGQCLRSSDLVQTRR